MQRRNKSIFFIFSTTITLLLLLSVGIVLVSSQKTAVGALHELASEVMLRTIEDSSQHVDAALRPAVTITDTFKQNISNSAKYPENDTILIKNLTNALKNHPSVYSVYFADQYGDFFLMGRRPRNQQSDKDLFFVKKIFITSEKRVVTETWVDTENKVVETETLHNDFYDPRSRPWYEKTISLAKPNWSDPYIFYITKKPGITFSQPILNSDGVVIGIVAADLEIKTISDQMMKAVFTENSEIFLVDENKRVIAFSGINDFYKSTKKGGGDTVPYVEDLGDNAISELIKQDRLENKLIDIDVNGDMFKAFFTKKEYYGLEAYLGIYTPSNDYLSPLYRLNKTLFIIILLFTFVGIMVSLFISKRMARPLINLATASEKAKALDFSDAIQMESRISEIVAMTSNFNSMLDNLTSYKLANELLTEHLQTAHLDTLYRIAIAAEFKDSFTADHLRRVSNISVYIATLYGLPDDEIELLRHASAMHDVGKIGIPDEILTKPGKLLDEEFEIIKKHSIYGYEMLDNPSSDIMAKAQIVALNHHEKWDGTGYPNGVKGEDIPLMGRIVAIADVIDALISKRSYKEAFSFEKTIKIIGEMKGTHFDPTLTELILSDTKTLYDVVFDNLDNDCK